MNKILNYILSTRRPTNNPAYCLVATQDMLGLAGITDYEVDEHMNVVVDRGGTTCFTSHQDTVDNKLGKNILTTKDGMVSVFGGGVLGADCGSGMYIMVRMLMESKPGLYVFFSTEEQGRIGSSAYTMPDTITKCVSFDRKGVDNLITHQMGERGCSEAFADAFIESFALPYKKDPTGSFTDSYSFFSKVSECINMSVGYYNQHTKQESQDIEFLEQLVDACIDLDWESLPVERDPVTVEWDDPDWDFYRPGYPSYKSSNMGTFSNGDTPHIKNMDDFVYEYPYVVSDLLEAYGITLDDLMKYKDSLDLEEKAA